MGTEELVPMSVNLCATNILRKIILSVELVQFLVYNKSWIVVVGLTVWSFHTVFCQLGRFTLSEGAAYEREDY